MIWGRTRSRYLQPEADPRKLSAPIPDLPPVKTSDLGRGKVSFGDFRGFDDRKVRGVGRPTNRKVRSVGLPNNRRISNMMLPRIKVAQRN